MDLVLSLLTLTWVWSFLVCVNWSLRVDIDANDVDDDVNVDASTASETVEGIAAEGFKLWKKVFLLENVTKWKKCEKAFKNFFLLLLRLLKKAQSKSSTTRRPELLKLSFYPAVTLGVEPKRS